MSKHHNGWLIYKKADAERNKGFIHMLVEEAALVGISLKLIVEEELSYGIQNQQLSVHHPKVDVRDIEFAIVRTINPLLTKQFEFMGIRCFNSSNIAELCNDKARTYQHIARLGIPILDSIFITYETFLPETLSLPFPMVLKQVDGRGGNEVYLVNSIDEVKEKLREYQHKNFVLQQFSDNPGKDIRVFVLGKKVIGAVLRESDTSFKANYTLGGRVRFYELNKQEKELVEKIISSLHADFIGIDFLLDQSNELIFNEIEDVVGCRSLYSTSDINAAKEYMIYIKNNLEKIG
jgi:gamma-F420-2:alpha-L-glutamate ligase